MRRILIFFCVCLSLNIFSQADISNYDNLIKCNTFPDSPIDEAEYYTSRGLWYGFTIPDQQDKNNYGKFGGPYCIRTQKWISKSLIDFDFGIAGKGVIPLYDADSVTIRQLPGLLTQKFFFNDITVELKLNIITNKTCLYQAYLINTDATDKSVSIRLKGTAFENIGIAEEFLDGWMFKIDGKDDIFWLIRFRTDNDMEMQYSETDYEFSYKELQTIHPGDTLKMVATISQYFQGDSKHDVQIVSEALEYPQKYEENNTLYWNIINNLVATEDDESKLLSYKSILTLFNNLRCPLPGTSNYFVQKGHGKENSICDTDEAWMIASALIKFDTRLAMHQLASVLTSINPDSSINKYLNFSPGSEISSPINQKPMAAWTCWNIFSVSKDFEFLTQAFPLLEAYHNFWYTNYDINDNLWCENTEGNESVELNALLYTEKYCLEKISNILGDTAKSTQYKIQTEFIRNNFNDHFYSENLQQYCDISILSDTIIISNTAAGYCMWSGLSSYTIAAKYANNTEQLLTSGHYKDLFASGKYNIEYYYFLISGLKLYGYNQISDLLKSELISEEMSSIRKTCLKYYDLHNGSFIQNSSITAAIILLLINY